MACNLCTSYGCFLKGITWISVRCFHRLNASKSCHRCWWLPLWTPDLNRWKRPFKPRIRPEKDHTRLVGICQNWEPTWIIWSLGSQFTPSQPRQSQVSRWWPQKEQAVLRAALMASSWALRCGQGWWNALRCCRCRTEAKELCWVTSYQLEDVFWPPAVFQVPERF